MTAYVWAALGTLFTFLMTTLGASMVFCFRHTLLRRSHLFLSFASGIMLAAAIFSLILPAMDRATMQNQSPLLIAALGVALGTLFMLVLDKPARRGIGNLRGGAALTFLSITLHNIPEGMAVGLSFALAANGDALALAAAITLALGIGLQNFPEGAAVSLPLCHEGFSRGKAFLYGALSGIVEPLFGVLTVLFVAQAQNLLPLLMAFAGGAMLFVTFRETLPSAARQDAGPWPGILVTLGFLIMMSLDLVLG